MKISELVLELEDLYNHHGDLDVLVELNDGCYAAARVCFDGVDVVIN